jgi:hypothetical protein
MAQTIGKQNPVYRLSEFVMNHSTSVTVNEEQIPEFCEFLVEEYDFELPQWDAPVFPQVLETPVEEVVDYFMVGNALNYCFNDIETGEKFAVEFLGDDWAGAFGMWAALMKEYHRNPDILQADVLKSLTRDDVERIFEPSNGVQIPLIDTRVEKLNTLGELMESEQFNGTYNNSFWNAFLDGSVSLYSGSRLIPTLTQSDAYVDEREYNGQTVQFDKRAQLAVSMIYGKLHGTEHQFEINDMGNFSVFADYGVPAGLATHNIISYDENLQNDIDTQNPIPEGSSEEVEIRAATVASVTEIQEHLEDNYNVSAEIPYLDYVLWQMRNDADTNVHLTETTAY